MSISLRTLRLLSARLKATCSSNTRSWNIWDMVPMQNLQEGRGESGGSSTNITTKDRRSEGMALVRLMQQSPDPGALLCNRGDAKPTRVC